MPPIPSRYMLFPDAPQCNRRRQILCPGSPSAAAGCATINVMDRQVWRRVARWLALAAGLALLAGASALATTSVDWSSIRNAPWWASPAMALAVLANLVLTAALFWAITRSFDARPPVGHRRMLQLICASGLLNYLPLRPGLLGRAAYLKLHHGLPIRQSVLILIVTLAVGGLVLATTAVVVLASSAAWRPAASVAVLIALVLAAPLTGPVARRLLRRPTVMAWTWVPLKVADMLVGGVKLWLALAVVGQTVSLEQALAVRAAGSIIDMIGVTPNGIGLREWVIGAVAAVTGLVEGPVAIAASLFERAVEALVVLIAGLVAIARLRRVREAPLQQPP